MEAEKICQNCSGFIQDSDDFKTGLGVCVNDPVFHPFWDDILESADFSKCYELYCEKRYNAESEACGDYEEPEILEEAEFDPQLYIENLKNQDVEPLTMLLYNKNELVVNNTVSYLSNCIRYKNESAHNVLLDYYMKLGAAESLEEVHRRLEIIDVLSLFGEKTDLAAAYIHELFRTQSNNTTRKLYTDILNRLSRYPLEIVEEPLLELLENKKYSSRIKNRILEVATSREDHDWWFLD